MPTVELSAGKIEYDDNGGDGPVVVLIGGLAIGRDLWDGVAARLRDRYRVIVPTLPWGAHPYPMNADADLSFHGHVKILAEFLDALDLRDITLVENDTGMAQVLCVEQPWRIARLVITSCEAFENYPPGLPGKLIGLNAKLPGGIWFAMQQTRIKPLRRTPLLFGWMMKTKIPHARTDKWLRGLQSDKLIRRDLAKYVKRIDKGLLTRNAERLHEFDKPVLIAWAKQDRVMPPAHAQRFATLFPAARLEWIEDSYTLIPIDQPARLAELISEHVDVERARPVDALDAL